MTIGNQKMNVAVIWFEAVNAARREVLVAKRAIKFKNRSELSGALMTIAAQYETWVACQKRLSYPRMPLETRQIADLYCALDIRPKSLYHLNQATDWTVIKREFGHIEELIKTASNLPLFSKS